MCAWYLLETWCGGGIRAAVRSLSALVLKAWDQREAHARADLCAIDLICGSREWRPTLQGRIDPVTDDVVMSDHAGSWGGAGVAPVRFIDAANRGP
jgi:hypothetical protein